ncbi:MAG TPA: hypothetical protein VFT75_17710 [Nocardioidaceae bacterium]|jgi:hypothetical protein|nr:hypothetical protein [Nocardioidaceae bacterium]
MTQITPAHRSLAHPALGSPLRSSLRWVAVLTLVVSAAVHIPVTPEHLEEAPYIGYLFVALTVVCFALALVIAVADTAAVWAVSGVVTALAVGAYLLSRSVALPQIGDDVGNWLEPLGVVAIVFEGLTAGLAVAALRRARPRPARG